MNRRIVAAAASVPLAAALAACGGASKTPATPVGNETATATSRAGGSTAASGTSATPGVPTLTGQQATLTAGVDPGLAGGDPNAAPAVISTIPAVKSKGTPVVDSMAVAPPNVDAGGVSMLLDLDASTPGIQATRSVNVGDTFRVAVVVTNAPPYQNGLGGIDALDFEVDYDRTKVVAPTIAGGPPTDRNPRLNADDLGGATAGWLCLPAPEGDLDDPGGTNGDGKPDTGQAFLSCFTPSPNTASGTSVLATIEFIAVASGTLNLGIASADVSDAIGQLYAYCGDSPGNGTVVPCTGATLTVK